MSIRTVLLQLAFGFCLPLYSGQPITLSTGDARIILDERGRVTSIRTNGGRELAPTNAPAAAFEIVSVAGVWQPTGIERNGNVIKVVFAEHGFMQLMVTEYSGFAILGLTELVFKDAIERIRFFCLPVQGLATPGGAMNACYDDQFAVAVMGTQINVHATLYGASGHLQLAADVLTKHGLQPAGVGIIACSRDQFERTIERFEQAAGLPSPHPGGVWSKLSPETKRSYLFIAKFKETDTDDVITFAKRGGFGTILISQDSWCGSTGHYPVNTKAFAEGLTGLQKTVARMKRAGLKVGLHFLAPSILPPDPYLTPIPDPRLVRDAHADLSTEVDSKADFIPTSQMPESFPAEGGGETGPGTIIQIGQELIHYRERSMQAPYGFRGCTRGLHGTAATSHSRAEKVDHLLQSYGYFLFDMDSTLLDEVAEHFARVANACEIDMVYWDGSERLQGDHWYYNAKLHKAFYDRLKNKDMLCQGSTYSHFSWHIVSRFASADGHGDLKGYLDQRSVQFADYRRNLMPIDIGWYYVYDTKSTLDQYEYILNKCLGHDASFSLQTSPDVIRTHPYIGAVVDMVGAYERLRLKGNLSEDFHRRLRVPQVDYHLHDGKLQRVVYTPWHTVMAIDGKSNVWYIDVKEGPAKVGLQLRVLEGGWPQPGASYAAAGSRLLEDFHDPRAYRQVEGLRPGVTHSTRPGSRGVVYSAASSLKVPEGWSYVGKRFNPPLDLSSHKGIGFWLCGDGKGGLFKLQMGDDKGATDYYIANDYQGWRYHQLAWPSRNPIDCGHVSSMTWYFNNLPPHSTVSCEVAGVRALPALDQPTLEQPSLTVGTISLSWPVSLHAGQTLTHWPRESHLPVLVLPTGRHTVRFTSSGGLNLPVSLSVVMQEPEELGVVGWNQ